MELFLIAENINNYFHNVIPGMARSHCENECRGKYMLYVPADLGYGEEGLGDIPPHSTLILK